MSGRRRRFSRYLTAALLFQGALLFGATPVTVKVSRNGNGSLASGPTGPNVLGKPEFLPEKSDHGDAPFSVGRTNRTIATKTGSGPNVQGKGKAKSNPELVFSVEGLNHRQQRLANGGNQFSNEPPDQGLCAGNGFLMESVNTALRIFDANGNALTGVVDLNTFYGYPAGINRSNGKIGPSIYDPSCYFDHDTQRWFHIVGTVDVDPDTGDATGTDHIDIAVSTTSNPLGGWIVYRLPTQNDGTGGTPNHNCGGPCFADNPIIGADANAIFITENEFALLGDGITGAQIYALPKQALVNGANSVTAVLFNTGDPSIPFCGFSVKPAVSGNGESAGDHGGTEYFLSSDAVCSITGTSSDIVLWSISNTKAINSANPALVLSGRFISVNPYGVPPFADQKAGDYPLGQCLSDVTCSNFLLGSGPYANTEKSMIEGGFSEMQQVYLANGKLWSALETAVWVGGAYKAGIAYFVLNPNSGQVTQQGVVAVQNNNVIYPAIAVNKSGRGIMAFTLLGADHYPSAAYTSLDEKIGAGDIHIVAEGAGPDDGFAGYNPHDAFTDRQRWGDYSGAVSDGDTLWIASEYIAQTCTLTQYVAGYGADFGSCGGSRTALSNWSTRISKLKP